MFGIYQFWMQSLCPPLTLDNRILLSLSLVNFPPTPLNHLNSYNIHFSCFLRNELTKKNKLTFLLTLNVDTFDLNELTSYSRPRFRFKQKQQKNSITFFCLGFQKKIHQRQIHTPKNSKTIQNLHERNFSQLNTK